MTEPDITLPVVTATAPTMMAPLPQTVQPLSPESRETLQQQGFPPGLMDELASSKVKYPMRFWIIDNSGSMGIPDGHRLAGSKEKIQIAPCSRWAELQGAVKYHTELAGLLEAPTVFRLLNDPGRINGPQEFSVAVTQHSSVYVQVEHAKEIIDRETPHGTTPLTAHVLELCGRIGQMRDSLKTSGQTVVVVIATDGLPNDSTAFLQALQQLQTLPVWIVIRLCTDDDQVVDYYNELDEKLEMPLEVLDDFLGEGTEVHKVNPWLNYGLPLHRCREMGHSHRVLDMLDERLLSKDELVDFCKLLFGADMLNGAPDVHANWKEFSAFLGKLVKQQGNQWDPVNKKNEPWINMKKLEKAYGDRRGFGLFRRK